MSFLYPFIFILLLFPVFGFFLSFTSQKNSFEELFSMKILHKLRLHDNLRYPKLKYRLFLLTLILFIFALARPYSTNSLNLSSSLHSNIIIALDISLSMTKKDIYPTRLQLALAKLQKFIDLSDSIEIGILLFSHNSYLLYPLTQDTKSLSSLITNIQIPKKLQQSTNLLSAFEASNFLLQNYLNKNILLLSDGGEDVSRSLEKEYLKKQHLKLFTLSTHPKTNPELLKLSKESGGAYIDYAWGESDVQYLLQEIKNSSLHPEYQNYKTQNYKEYFYYPLAFGIVLLLLISPSIYPSFMLLLVLFSSTLDANLLDFYYLYKAKDSFGKQEYKSAVHNYKKLTPTPKIYYNIATNYYKLKKYKDAIIYYKKALSTSKKLNANIYYNIANSYVKIDKLETAKHYYLKSLQLKTSQETEENLLQVKQELKKRKKLFTKKDIKIQFKNRLKEKQDYYYESSRYTIKLTNLLLSQEEQWIKKVHDNSTLYLQLIPTQGESLDANYPH